MKCFFRTQAVAWMSKDHPVVLQIQHLLEAKRPRRVKALWGLLPGLTQDVVQLGAQLMDVKDLYGAPTWVATIDARPTFQELNGIQEQAIDSYTRLRAVFDDEFEFRPSLVGAQPRDLSIHADLWRAAGVQLDEVLVSLPQAAHTSEGAIKILGEFRDQGMKLHLLDHKVNRNSPPILKTCASFDTQTFREVMSDPPLPECKHKVCNNCLPKALKWEQDQLAKLRVNQPSLL